MADLQFINVFGRAFNVDESVAQQRSRRFLVIKKEDELLCLYDKVNGVYEFPDDEIIGLEIAPSYSFELHENIFENGNCFKETQVFDVFEVEKASVEGELLKWCKIEDILLSKIHFSAVLKKGLNNLFVRGR